MSAPAWALRRCGWLAAAFVLCAPAPLAALGPPDGGLRALESRMADPALPPAQRDAAAEARIELLSGLIRDEPDSDEAPSRMVDLAQALLARLGRDGADSEVLLGIPIGDQRARVLAAASRAHDLLALAAEGAARVAARLDRPALDPSGEELLSRLREFELGVRIPLLRARALLLRAAAEPGGGQLAGDAAAELERVTLEGGPADLWRRANLALARSMGGEDPPGRAKAAFVEVADAFARADAAGEAIDFALWAEVRLGALAADIAASPTRAAAELDALLASRPFSDAGAADPLLTLLACDAAARALADRPDPAALDSACAILASLARREPGLPPEEAHAIALGKLAALTAGMAPETLAPIAALARAVEMARDPAQRSDASALLEATSQRNAARTPAEAPVAAEALWELAVLHGESDRPAAARALFRLAKEFPASPRARPAIQIALAEGRALAGDPDFRGLYLDTLALASASYADIPGMDFWRFELATALLASGSRDAALAELERIDAASPSGPAAGAMYTEAIDAALAQPGAYATARAALARRAAAWAARAAPAQEPRYRADLADALTDAGSREGVAIYRKLLDSGDVVPGGRGRLVLGLARGLIQSGQTDEGFAGLRGLVSGIDDSSAAVRDATYWHAWTLILETLAARQDRAGVIRAHIARLQSLDPSLGGEPWRSRIERIRRDLGDR